MENLAQSLKDLKIKQVDILFRLREKGIKTELPTLSGIIRGVHTFPKALMIKKEIVIIIGEILNERKNESK